ncbi:PP2C family serine/threonine-protein phosphatase [Sphingomonas colocasiae]|uniref:Protein phosphatase 2C domain-containing protein n=1 Tax=Sphingomonas colocasiae TaxID=1848973 RepID=A0ABS7PVZ2_9SPHN|nr:protein phosphatase 2C domain-containing protein [Sphingomonas colocasiae]
MGVWTWAAAGVRGTSHAKTGTRCQDAHAVAAVGESLCAMVSDGAGSASYGGQGAQLVCRTLMRHARVHFERSRDAPSDDVVWSWIDDTRDRIGLAAEVRGLVPRDFSATLVAVLIGEKETSIIQVGDGVAALLGDFGGGWSVPLWPAHGEYASATYFVTDDSQPQVRIERVADPINAIALMSDGLERLALNFSCKIPHDPFFNGMIAPLRSSTGDGRDAALSRALAAYLDGDTVNARTDDDKSLILAVRR